MRKRSYLLTALFLGGVHLLSGDILYQLTKLPSPSLFGFGVNDAGQVTVTWSMDEHAGEKQLHLRWQEKDGPAVKQPERRGFGSRLIERGLSGELGGTVRLDFAPTGLICSVDAPLREPVR